MKEAEPYLTCLTHVTLVLLEVLHLRGMLFPMMVERWGFAFFGSYFALLLAWCTLFDNGFGSPASLPPPSTRVTPTPRTPSNIGRQTDVDAPEAVHLRTEGGADTAASADVAYIAQLDNSVVHALRCLGSLMQYKTTADAKTESLVELN